MLCPQTSKYTGIEASELAKAGGLNDLTRNLQMLSPFVPEVIKTHQAGIRILPYGSSGHG